MLKINISRETLPRKQHQTKVQWSVCVDDGWFKQSVQLRLSLTDWTLGLGRGFTHAAR